MSGSSRRVEKRLAMLALVLGGLSVFGDPYGGGSVRLHPQELAAIVESKVDHVTVDELADWILQGRNDYRLLDLREAGEYAEYHIPTAESVRLTELGDYPLNRNETIVVYSGGGIHSAQAWFLLEAQRYAGAKILLGGLEEWKDQILFPRVPVTASAEEQVAYERRSQASRFFGGTPQTGSTETADRPDVPMPKAPVAGQGPVVVRKRKRKEGC